LTNSYSLLSLNFDFYPVTKKTLKTMMHIHSRLTYNKQTRRHSSPFLLAFVQTCRHPLDPPNVQLQNSA